VIEKDLLWCNVERQVEQGDNNWLDSEQSKITLGFDPALPLKEQLVVAKRYLIAIRYWMSKEEQLEIFGIKNQIEPSSTNNNNHIRHTKRNTRSLPNIIFHRAVSSSFDTMGGVTNGLH
jgi:hypothetical protein